VSSALQVLLLLFVGVAGTTCEGTKGKRTGQQGYGQTKCA